MRKFSYAGLMKLAGYNAAGHAFDLDEARQDDEYFDDRSAQLDAAGRTSGNFVAGGLVGGGNAQASNPQASNSATADYSGFNTWYGNNRDAFRAMFTDSAGNFSTADFNRFKAAHPRFFTGTNDLRDRMFAVMSHSAGNGVPYTTANSGHGYDFSGTSMDYNPATLP